MTLISWLRQGLAWLWGNKAKLGLSLLSAMFFILVLFPFNDLSDLISRQVSLATNNSVSLQFGHLDLSLFPQLGAQAEQVYVETAFFPGITVQELTVTPSVGALISQKPFGHASAKGIFKGDLDASIGNGGTSERGNELQRLEISAKKLSIEDLRAFGNLPLMLKGRLDLETAGLIDMNLQEQPDIELNMKIDQLEMPPSNIPLGDMGDLTLPEVKISAVELKGKLSNGRLTIENMKIGSKPADDLLGSVKGSMTMNFRGGPNPDFGSYTFEIDLKPSNSFRDRAKFFLEFIAGYRQGDRYRMKVTGSQFGAPPSMTPLQ